MDRPWFKFTANNWLSGSVQLLDAAEKGTYIDLIAMIWKEGGKLENTKILHRKLRLDNATACERINSYCDLDILVCEDNFLSIKFLDDQINSYKTTCEKNAENAAKRWDKEPKAMRPDANKKRREEKREEEKIKSKPKKDEPLTVSIQIDPLTITRPKPDAWSKFCETYPKPFNPMCSYTRSAFHEAVSIADGDDVILAATSMYSNYFTKTNEPLQYASSAQKWLESQSWRTDWNAEAVKKKSSGKKGMSNSKPSVIKKGDVF